MSESVIIMEKMENGELVKIDERAWSATMVAMLEHANYLLINDKEYEMVEGRLNVNLSSLELLVVPITLAEAPIK